MRTKQDRLALLLSLIEFDLSIIQTKYEPIYLAAVQEGAWTDEHEMALNKLEASCKR